MAQDAWPDVSTLTVNDIVRACLRAGAINRLDGDGLHRAIRYWAGKGLIYSWGRAGQAKTAGHLYDFNQVYRAIFLYRAAAQVGESLSRLNAFLGAFDGHGEHSLRGAHLPPENFGAVYRIANIGPCHIVSFMKRVRPQPGRESLNFSLDAGIHLVPTDGTDESLWAALKKYGDVHGVSAFDLCDIVRPILAIDPRPHADLPYTTEPPERPSPVSLLKD